MPVLQIFRNNIRFQLGCWEMQHNPYGMSEEGTSAASWHSMGHFAVWRGEARSFTALRRTGGDH